MVGSGILGERYVGGFWRDERVCGIVGDEWFRFNICLLNVIKE